MATGGQEPIFVEANVWTNIFATVTDGVNTETVIQSDAHNRGPMELCWGGAEPSGAKGIVLAPGAGDFDIADACWVRFPGTAGGTVRCTVRA